MSLTPTNITLYRGQTASVAFAFLDEAGAAFNFTGFTVTLNTPGLSRTATMPTPSSGAGSFDFVAADYAVLRPGRYPFTVWAVRSAPARRTPFAFGFIDVVDVQQAAA
jgi:hypothetical protein